jgi:hypothetical protein
MNRIKERKQRAPSETEAKVREKGKSSEVRANTSETRRKEETN